MKGKPFIYCADAGLGSYHIRNFNSMNGRSFIVTQSIKKLSDVLQQAVFNDYDYRLLSSGEKVSIKELMEFDRKAEKNKPLYIDKAYKVIPADDRNRSVCLGRRRSEFLFMLHRHPQKPANYKQIIFIFFLNPKYGENVKIDFLIDLFSVLEYYSNCSKGNSKERAKGVRRLKEQKEVYHDYR